jgi:hypothetical protein
LRVTPLGINRTEKAPNIGLAGFKHACIVTQASSQRRNQVRLAIFGLQD